VIVAIHNSSQGYDQAVSKVRVVFNGIAARIAHLPGFAGHASRVGLPTVTDGLAADGEPVAAGLTAQVMDPIVLAVGVIED
jgi:hypothetical protein